MVMMTRRGQRGMTAIGWLLVLGLIAFFALLTLRLVPVYLEYTKVISVLESVAGQADIGQRSRGEIIKLIRRRFDVNDVRKVDPRQVKIKKDRDGMKLSIRYERREHLMGNIDIVATFSRQIEVEPR
ncbi:MAG TPA: DUF4845 domain-containing protein [Gammaproteobacteria bacterium]|nr:DUF4845 domain-containing protein [Gammaproteobacteria bacterium]